MLQPYFLSGGFGSCPVEDSAGALWYTNKLRLLHHSGITAEDRATDEKWWEEMHTYLSAGKNAADHSGSFDPRRFSLLNAQQRLAAATGSKANAPEKSEFFISHELDQSTSTHLPNSNGVVFNFTNSDALNTPEDTTSAAAKKRQEQKKVCAVCGVAVGLSACNGCKKVYYCSVAHQAQHWKAGGHKSECAGAKKKKKKKKKKKTAS